MTGVKNVRSFLSSYLEKDNSLGGHHLLVVEWPTLVTKFCACFAIRRASAEFHCSLHLKIKSIKIFHNCFLSLLFSLDVFSLFHRLFENNKKKLKKKCLSITKNPICDRLQENRAQRGPDKKFYFWHLQTPWQADIKLSKFYRHSFSHSRYISPNRSLR